jgi:uncharacterized damage-inducible protein DinB
MANPVEPPEPSMTLSDPGELLAGYLDYYRDALLRKLDGLSDQEMRNSRLPSGWVPLGLLKHLAYVELRWLRWGFAAEPVDEPWGDEAEGEPAWHLEPGETVQDITAFFEEQCTRSRAIVAGARLTDQAASGGRFSPNGDVPTLAWILFHVLQEYARHVGQLDVARELADGATGE